MEKKWFILSIGLALIILASFVSAYGYLDFRNAANDIIGWVKDIFGPFFAALFGVSEFDEYLFARILLALLMFIVIFAVTKKIKVFKEYTSIRALVAIIISVLGARFISESDFITGILIPYGALTVALSVALPFVIYFWFVEDTIESGMWRRVLWIIFGVTFVAIWISRIGETSGTISWIYFAGIIATIIALTFDGAIHRYFEISRRRETMQTVHDANYANLVNRFAEAETALSRSPDDERLRRNYNRLAQQLGRPVLGP